MAPGKAPQDLVGFLCRDGGMSRIWGRGGFAVAAGQ
jgi:hypothetical protein